LEISEKNQIDWVEEATNDEEEDFYVMTVDHEIRITQVESIFAWDEMVLPYGGADRGV